MRTSVIIPAYNEEKVIGKCLNSLGNQKLGDLEIILVDDGSSDRTISVARKSAIRNYKLRIYEQKHKGPGEARNLGAKRAKGRILVFVDADMTFDRNFISKLIAPIVDKKTKGTFSKEEYVSNWENVWARCWNINEGWEKRKRHPAYYPDSQKVFRALVKSEFDRVGGFDKGGHYTDDYLSDKLGYKASLAKGAKFYHENPDNLKEVFTQARWTAKRKYKLGLLGIIYALLRTSLPVSVIIGIIKSFLNLQPAFVVFKITYDLGAFIGIIEYVFLNKKRK